MATPTFWGTKFSVNTTTTDHQQDVKLHALKNGTFVAVWEDMSGTGGDTDSGAIRGQIFNADGTKRGGEFLVNQSAYGLQMDPQVTVLSDGPRVTRRHVGRDRGSFGPDIEFLDRALSVTFDRCAVDRNRVAIGGFWMVPVRTLGRPCQRRSRTHILACSPGFVSPGSVHGRPRIFVSHGTADRILPIGSTSRRIVPLLEKSGYAVTYREFDEPHTAPPPIAREAFTWFTGEKPRVQ